VTPVEREPGGRVHLTVHRDPASGEERVTLTAPVFEEAWQNEIATAAAQTVHGTLAREASLEAMVALARNAMDATEKLIDALLARAPAGTLACRAGCDHCCYQSVGVTPPEALAIFDHLSRTLPDELRKEYLKHCGLKRLGRIDEVAGLVAWLAVENTFVTGQTMVLDGAL